MDGARGLQSCRARAKRVGRTRLLTCVNVTCWPPLANPISAERQVEQHVGRLLSSVFEYSVLYCRHSNPLTVNQQVDLPWSLPPLSAP